MFSLASRIKSFRHALEGLAFVMRTQRNAWIHAAAAIVVALAGFTAGLTPQEWLWIILAIALVWIAEVFNTAFEHLCDVVQPEFHASVKAAKDVAAGAVLLAACAAVLIGALVFWPHLSGWSGYSR